MQLTLTDNDRKLWKTMDEATYQAIAVMARSTNGLQYWHSDGSWKTEKPDQAEIRIPGVVHEGATLYMGAENEKNGSSKPSVDDNYRPFGVNNVYVTGGAIFPTIGSWNPTLTMCGYAQDLARKLVKETGQN